MGNRVNKEVAANVVLLLTGFAGTMAEAPRERTGVTFRRRAKRHWIAVVIVRADQVMLL